MRFQTFSSFEEARAEMERAERQANAQVTETQRRISFGGHWMRPMGSEYEYLVIFGRVQSLAEMVASEALEATEFDGAERREAAIEQAHRIIDAANRHLSDTTVEEAMHVDDGVALDALLKGMLANGVNVDAEGVAILEGLPGIMGRGYRFSKSYSIVEPEGEYGDTHISTMIPLRPTEFEDARAHGWNFGELSHPDSANRKDWAVNLVIQGARAYGRDIREVR